METREIEEVLSSTRLLPPKTIFVLSSPIISPEFKALIRGLNPRFERHTAILGSDATPETVIHETLHRMGLGEATSYPLAKLIVRFRTAFPATRRKQIRYEERTLTSEELEKYGLHSYQHVDGYIPAKLEIKELKLVE